MTTIIDTSTDRTSGLTTTAGKLADLRACLAGTQAPVSQTGIDRVHNKGETTARERIEFLLDKGSFVEVNALARHRSKNFGLDAKHPVTGGVVTGYGTIDDRQVCIFSQDGAIFGGVFDEVHGERIVKVMDLIFETGIPIVDINEGAGACTQEGVVSLDLYSQIFFRNTQVSGVIPQISLVMGAYAGSHVYSPTLTDSIIMVGGTSKVFVTGPDVIKTTIGEEVTQEELGGAGIYIGTSGTSHYTATDDEDAPIFVQELASYLSSNSRAKAPRMEAEPLEGVIADNITESDLGLDTLIPGSPNQPYDARDVIIRPVDDGDFLEIQEDYAQNAVIGFGRVEDHLVGLVANQPTQFADCLDVKTSEKAARFVRTCDTLNIPIIMLVDVPGFLPDADQEFDDIIRRGTELLHAYTEVTIPKIMVITRKAYGGAHCVMGSKDMGADISLAWSTAQIAVMGASDAIDFIYRKEPKTAATEGKDVVALQKEYEVEYETALINSHTIVGCGFIGAAIPSNETHGQIIENLRPLDRKAVSISAKKHGSIPP